MKGVERQWKVKERQSSHHPVGMLRQHVAVHLEHSGVALVDAVIALVKTEAKAKAKTKTKKKIQNVN